MVALPGRARFAEMCVGSPGSDCDSVIGGPTPRLVFDLLGGEQLLLPGHRQGWILP